MNNAEYILERIQKIFIDVFDDAKLEISMSSNSNSISDWDSISNILLIDKIEQEFSLEFPIDVIYESKNVGDWVDFILNN
jgi:acyl carrier protein